MRSKTFFCTALGSALAVLLALTVLLSVFDPFFVVKGLDKDDRAMFTNQRYETAGLIRNQSYSAVVVGTSLVANHRASWYTQGLGKETLKITFPGGWLPEFDEALTLAWTTHPELDTVYFGFDLNVLIRDPAGQDVELPHFLYNTNPLDNVEYFLNKETYIQAARSAVQRSNGQGVPLDEAYIWDTTAEFSRAHSLQVYARPRDREPSLPADTYLSNARANLAVVTSWIEAHPDTQFTIWFAPYSVLFWDYYTRIGRGEAYLAALELAWETLTGYDNVRLFSFLDREDIAADLDNYTDYIHCSGAVTHLEAQSMMAGEDPITAQSYPQRLEQLRRFIEDYDYDAIFL